MDIAHDHPAIVKSLDGEYDHWWSTLAPYLVNETAIGPPENSFKTLFRQQFGSEK